MLAMHMTVVASPEHAPLPVPTVEDAMLASIARTAFFGETSLLPQFAKGSLEDNNRAVQANFGDQARRLLIVGPDAVCFEDQPALVLTQRHAAEVLGALIDVRGLALRREYANHGILRDMPAHTRPSRVDGARNWLRSNLVDRDGESVVRFKGIRGGGTYGLPDVLVKDVRQTNHYQSMRGQKTLEVCQAYLDEGGPMPAIYEIGSFRAAQQALRTNASIDLTRDQRIRFARINQQITRHLSNRTDEYNQAHPLQTQLSDTAWMAARRAVADTFGQSWKTRGACANLDEKRKAFFAPDAAYRKEAEELRVAYAKAICATCPIRAQCLDYARQNGETEGIWGGVDFDEERKEAQREDSRQRRARQAEASQAAN